MACNCTCTCCGYPNGLIQVILMQFLLLCGWTMSLAALVDCKFVETSTSLTDPNLGDLGINPRFGFFVFELPNGSCSYDLFQNNSGLWDAYRDLLGNDWNAPRVLAAIAMIAGLILWIFSLLYTCVSHILAMRIIFSITMVVVTLFQGLSFLVFSSRFCNAFNCSLTTSSYVSIASTICYFLSCTLFCCMKNYKPEDRAAAAAVTKDDTKEEDEEKPEEEEQEEEPKEEAMEQKEETQEEPAEEKAEGDVEEGKPDPVASEQAGEEPAGFEKPIEVSATTNP